MTEPCQDFQSRLSRHFDGEGPHPGEAHLAGCSACRAYLHSATRLRQELPAGAGDLPPAVRAAILQTRSAGKAQTAPAARVPWREQPWLVPALAGALLVVLVLVGIHHVHISGPDAHWATSPRGESLGPTGFTLGAGESRTLVSALGNRLSLWAGPASIKPGSGSAGSPTGRPGQTLELTSGQACLSWEARRAEPLFLTAGVFTIRVKGTVFRVRLTSTVGVEVAVSEGEVEVSHPTAGTRTVPAMKILTWQEASLASPTLAAFNPMNDPAFQDPGKVSVVEH